LQKVEVSQADFLLPASLTFCPALTAKTRISNAHIVGLVRFEDYGTAKMADLEIRLACREAASTARPRNYLTNS
jgi:hypothetical protein